ncbi:hypothetical protein [Paraoerskovia marina]|uniref:Uncharacterized protein n=1 Tax=Paraoerskovia marina TaxID=545619 RepID=A0A1H1MJR9_9CELL|nr:hypothetical protein [Paraoerskovia marina]SDR87023.1 hypothetical protein SAMN04489860_0261 [Paraoerskovia marina]
MRDTETPIFDALAHEFEAQRPLLHVARALGGDALGDPLSTTQVSAVSYSTAVERAHLPRRSRRSQRPGHGAGDRYAG